MQTTRTLVSIAIIVVMLSSAAILMPLDKASALKRINMNASTANQTSKSSSPAAGNWTDAFKTQRCSTWTPTGSNMYMNLIPGHQANFTGVVPGGDQLKVSITVTNQVKVMPDGIPTRVVNDTVVNAQSGALKEIALDYYAICKDTNSVFYFGEKTAEYENGKIANTTGTWQHGVDGAHAGVAVPGLNLLGAQYYQEVAPKVALDQGQTVSVTDNNNTKLCNNNCLKVAETTPFEPGIVEYKIYAPNVGLVYDHGLTLVTK
jgi:hypothetical protein